MSQENKPKCSCEEQYAKILQSIQILEDKIARYQEAIEDKADEILKIKKDIVDLLVLDDGTDESPSDEDLTDYVDIAPGG